jgi:hypothetical protein
MRRSVRVALALLAFGEIALVSAACAGWVRGFTIFVDQLTAVLLAAMAVIILFGLAQMAYWAWTGHGFPPPGHDDEPDPDVEVLRVLHAELAFKTGEVARLKQRLAELIEERP